VRDLPSFRWYWIVLAIVVVLAINVIWAAFFYDDWRCAFSECRIIKTR
jgi:hypothetical protein